MSVPEFFVATLAVLLFAVKLRWLPALSSVSNAGTVEGFLRAYALPVLTLSCVICAQMTRISRPRRSGPTGARRRGVRASACR